jgi:transposase-like protein
MSTLTKNWTPNRKKEVVLKLLSGGDAVSISRDNGISQSQLFEWRDKFIVAGTESLKTRRHDENDKKVRYLERLVGCLTMDNEILKKTELLQRRKIL